MADVSPETNVATLVVTAARRYGMNLEHTDVDAVSAIAERTSLATAGLVKAVEGLPLRTTDPAPR